MNRSLIGAGLAGLLGVSLALGCSSTSTPSTSTIACSILGGQGCYTYSNLSGSQVSAATSNCTGSLAGTIVSSCPTANQVGCCAYTLSGIAQNLCSYCGSASTYQAQCASIGATNPVWTAGSGGGPATCTGGGTPDAGEPANDAAGAAD